MIKLIIAVLFIAMLASLTTSFAYLMADQGQGEQRRTYFALGIRLVIAVSLITTIIFGIYTGQLNFGAPWSR